MHASIKSMKACNTQWHISRENSCQSNRTTTFTTRSYSLLQSPQSCEEYTLKNYQNLQSLQIIRILYTLSLLNNSTKDKYDNQNNSNNTSSRYSISQARIMIEQTHLAKEVIIQKRRNRSITTYLESTMMNHYQLTSMS